ncbi:hypothetical protein VPDG_00079 [Vibrio phage henriette 12B8]|uniref:hypothetical protein n=1 Tax=Vibrio phage henriette 12B8 TaxID=573174 RepID=UPI0002C10875|nr:hypothetical protein VPDG_00079 [Vibrio phage henriette 12B8]AGG58240.1 hypothetical protein VPDG_00079 [Vibrio phage henriette 12B8]
MFDTDEETEVSLAVMAGALGDDVSDGVLAFAAMELEGHFNSVELEGLFDD